MCAVVFVSDAIDELDVVLSIVGGGANAGAGAGAAVGPAVVTVCGACGIWPMP